MPQNEISRWSHSLAQSVTFTTSIGTTGGFGMNIYAGGMLMVVSGTATLTFHVRPTESSSDSYEVASTSLLVEAGKAYPLPDAIFAASYVQAVSSSGNVVCKVLLKG